MAPPPGFSSRPAPHRTVGMAVAGSALALAAAAGLAIAGVLPVAEEARSWVAAGLGLAAAMDGGLALYFLRKASDS